MISISSGSFRQVNVKMNKKVLDKIDEALDCIKNFNEDFNVSRNTLIHALLLVAMNGNEKVLDLDGVKYTFNELLQLKNN